MGGMTEAEAVAIMIGDIKLSMPGLQKLQAKGKSKSSHSQQQPHVTQGRPSTSKGAGARGSKKKK